MELQTISKSGQFQKYVPLQPEATQNCWSKLFFTWIHKVLYLGSSTRLENHHAFPLPFSEMVTNDNLNLYIQNHRLFTAIVLNNKKILSLGIILSFICVLLEFSGPVFMQLLMEYIDKDEKPLSQGVYLATAFTAATFSYPIVFCQRNFYTELTSIRIRNSLFNLIYNKSLNSANLPEGLGINLLQVDVTKIYEFFWFLPYILSIPFQIIFAVYLVYRQVGNAVWIAVGTIFVAMLSNFLLSPTCGRFYDKIMTLRDQRVECSTQLLTEIKMIKAYSWENHFVEKITGVRKLEISKMRVLNVLYSCNLFYFWALPSLVVVVVFAYYTVVMGEDISASKAFITLTTLLLLQIPLIGIPIVASQMVQLIVSHKRVHELIDAKAYKQVAIGEKVSFKNCNFSYGDKQILKKINLDINPGEFIAIIGPVGSGKSSLLLSIMGETALTSGTLEVNPNIAYAPSLDSWLLNASLRENILMGREYKEDWYNKVIDACCLVPDINSLPSGDNTEIGERGINLSGGQKARVCLARAVYSEREIYLLDDPLSSVDNHVASHIFNQCFIRLLRGKTRILVTHRHSFLNRVDRVVEMKEGEIDKIVSGNSEIVDETEEQEVEREQSEVETQKNEDKLIEEEDREVGEVDRQVYKEYFRYSGGYFWVSLAVLAILLWMGTRMGGDIFLKEWTNDPSDVSFYLPIYIALRLGGCIFIFFRSFILSVIMSPIISRNSHDKLMQAFIHAPINLFYDVTPLGRLLNRLTKDINMIDDEISFTVGSVAANICSTASCILMGVFYFPYLIVFIPIILIPARLISRYYMKTSRELTRLESISRSPMLNHFTETLSGSKFIRCFKQVDNFIKQNQIKINENMKLNYSKCACEQWMRLHLGLLSAVFLSSLFIAAIIFRNSISVGIVGLTLTYMIPLPETLSDLLMSLTSLENEMVSVERVKAYTDLPKERGFEISNDLRHTTWPASPTITFNKVHLRYRPNTPLVLKGLSFTIPSGLRVGITGRTGSGKSSLFLALLRIIELESGIITIDGVNIALLGLKKLRQAITLIPQDPLVFNGTMKENLDPFGIYEDKVIEKVLKEVGLKFSLDYEVKNSGKNISIGERQLVSLSRALVSNTKIILFDEATAGIDPESDRLIQEVIKGKFHGCTILTIAHRLGTIIESDLVLLLDDGKVLEMGDPKELMQTDSEFKILASKMH